MSWLNQLEFELPFNADRNIQVMPNFCIILFGRKGVSVVHELSVNSSHLVHRVAFALCSLCIQVKLPFFPF